MDPWMDPWILWIDPWMDPWILWMDPWMDPWILWMDPWMETWIDPWILWMDPWMYPSYLMPRVLKPKIHLANTNSRKPSIIAQAKQKPNHQNEREQNKPQH